MSPQHRDGWPFQPQPDLPGVQKFPRPPRLTRTSPPERVSHTDPAVDPKVDRRVTPVTPGNGDDNSVGVGAGDCALLRPSAYPGAQALRRGPADCGSRRATSPLPRLLSDAACIGHNDPTIGPNADRRVTPPLPQGGPIDNSAAVRRFFDDKAVERD